MKQETIIVSAGKTEPYTYQTLNVAINYAVKMHGGTFRKGFIPVIVHPLEVMNNLGVISAVDYVFDLGNSESDVKNSYV